MADTEVGPVIMDLQPGLGTDSNQSECRTAALTVEPEEGSMVCMGVGIETQVRREIWGGKDC